MRYLNLILIAAVIPMLLTATVFAVPSMAGGNGLFSILGNTATTNSASNNNALLERTNAGSFVQTAAATSGKTHDITMSAERLSNGLLAYKMVSYQVTDSNNNVANIANKYPSIATIPGPTIVLNEGDIVNLTVQNHLGSGIVGVHVHGVHYNINSDATLMHINGIMDEGATPGNDYVYHWVAGPGTAGSWPYHDHTFGGLNGAENKGLFGMVIVNPASGMVKATDGTTIKNIQVSSIKKNFVIYMGDNTFWGTEILQDGTQRALWTNPTLKTANGDYVRFNIIALGTDLHDFKLARNSWLDPGTSNLITDKHIGPLENHVFTLKAKLGTYQYKDLQVSNDLEGMQGLFMVKNAGSTLSAASPIPGPI